MNLEKAHNPQKIEDRIYNLWQKSGLFNPDNLPAKNKKPYTIVLPPPNVTGELHMGHALNATTQDIVIRFKRMKGYKALWLPGTDHAGIATQNVVEKNLKKRGITRFDMGYEKFIKEIWNWKEKYGNTILQQLKKLGSSCDWSRTRFTMDREYSSAVESAFLYFSKKGLIYRGERIVNWCPRCATSLSDLELEHTKEKSFLWFIKYPLKHTESAGLKNKYIIVATTRPETMLGDTGVAVNPKDKRYKGVIGATAILPIQNKEIPIIGDDAVDSGFGTGAVKITPAHDYLDWEIKERHNLDCVKIIDEQGKMNKNSKICKGLSIEECRKKVVETLENKKLIEKKEEYSHQIPTCYICRSKVEIIPSKQWFIKMKDLAQVAKIPVKKKQIKFHPKSFEKPYFDWLNNVRDWCISRQIWWGHRLPVWFCASKNQQEEKFIVSSARPKQCPFCKTCKMQQSPDVLDTWFSSALWPFATLGWPGSLNKKTNKPNKNSDLSFFYPTDSLFTARDIINLWVSRMIFSGIELMKKPPFKDVYIHATILTKDGKRMSKSMGTGIDPMNLVSQYGADATRFGMAYQITKGQDIKFSEDSIVMGKKFCNKLWNASKFVLLNSPKDKNIISLSFGKFEKTKGLTMADKKILKSLKKAIKEAENYIENFEFGKSARLLYSFFWHDFCDAYIEKSKNQKNKKITSDILCFVLLNSLKLLHPFIPFITEEIYQHFCSHFKTRPKTKVKYLIIETWPEH